MYISKEDTIKLNYFAQDQGGEALEFLADLIYQFYTKEILASSGDELLQNKGAAILAVYLKSLPKGLRDGAAQSNTR